MSHNHVVMHSIKSSQASQAGYDPATKTLAVEFKKGGVYHYAGVSQETYDGLMKAESFGKHLRAHVIGKHKHTKL